MKTEVTTFYLEMLTPAGLKPGKVTDLSILEAPVPCPELNRFLYTAVGANWYWCDRLTWTYQAWLTHLNQETVRTWVGYSMGNPAGYFELEQHRDRSVEILTFGLLPQFIGRGYGGHLLTAALQTAWAMAPERVWVHTCSLDGPTALKNYQARGMTIYQEIVTLQELPEVSPGPWPKYNE